MPYRSRTVRRYRPRRRPIVRRPIRSRRYRRRY